jgi:SAM-dependent methyltransferase
VLRFSSLVADGARVLDVACGQGRHSRWFAARGCRVVAVDRDSAALDQLASVAGVTAVSADLEADPWPFESQKFDAIIVANYLHRALFPSLLRALADDGVLVYETFARGNEAYGKPSNPDFLLTEGELLTIIGRSLIVVAFEQGRTCEPPAVVQRLAALGRRRSWPPPLPTAALPPPDPSTIESKPQRARARRLG